MDLNPELEQTDDIVSLCECDSEQEFIVIRGLLESAGIDSFSDSILWTRSIDKRDPATALALYVRRADLDDAHAVIDAALSQQPTDKGEEDS